MVPNHGCDAETRRTTMEVHGTRFGTLTFNEADVIHIDEGMMGFPMSRRYLMFPYGQDSCFFWLQSVDEPEIAFIVVNPFDFFSDLEFLISDEETEALGLERQEDVEIVSLVTIPDGSPEEMRTNLSGPVVVNVRNRRGKQMLFPEFSPRQPLIPEDLRGGARELARREYVERAVAAV